MYCESRPATQQHGDLRPVRKVRLAPAASSSPSNSSRPPQTAQPNAFAARGRHQQPRRPLFISWHQFAMNRGYLPSRIDKHERTVQAMRTTVGGALHAAQIDGDPIPRRRRTNFIEMSRLRLNRLGRVLGEDRLLEGGVKSRTVGESQPEWQTGNQRLAERHQAATLPCSLFDIRVHFCKRRRAIQPDWRNL